jgi:hypothetical protein
MEHRFFQTGEIEPHGSHATLNALQTSLRENQASGLIEVQVGAVRRVVLVYAHGTQSGVYLLEEGRSRPFHLAELSTLWGGAPFSIHTVNLPDRAGRAVWMALESRKQDPLEVRGNEAWNRLQQDLKKEGFSGLLEYTSDSMQGFAVVNKGEIPASESVFFNGQGFDNSPPSELPINRLWNVTIYSPSPSARSWQSHTIRTSALHWGNGVLERFQSIAGEKFLRVVDKEIRMLIQPWKWMIFLNGTTITDDHFFAGPQAAAHAYRAIFMGMGTHMGLVIGNVLTQRILQEMFEDLEQDERAALEAQRLIPAAFSN